MLDGVFLAALRGVLDEVRGAGLGAAVDDPDAARVDLVPAAGAGPAAAGGQGPTVSVNVSTVTPPSDTLTVTVVPVGKSPGAPKS